MKAIPSSASVAQTTSAEPPPAMQVLKPGKRRIIGASKFGKDGCGY